MLDPTKKRYPTSKGKGEAPERLSGESLSPQKEGVKLHLESNPIPARDTQRAQTKPCVHQDPETP